MADPDVFAILTPGNGSAGNNAEIAFGQRHNAARFQGQIHGPVSTDIANDSREPTPDPASPSTQRSESRGCLVLRFSSSFINAADGVLFGTSEKSSDIVIMYPGIRGVSRRHFSIVVKEDGSWFLEDHFSTFGTSVSYDGQAGLQKRTQERWILAHPPKSRNYWRELFIRAGNVEIRIDFPNQNAGHPAYLAKLEAFVQRSKKALPNLGVLGLESHQTTAAPSQVASPNRSRQPIYIEFEEVGQGAFARVLKVMSCRDGLFYAKKKFFQPIEGRGKSGRKRRWDSQAWFDNKRKEADIMRRNVHASNSDHLSNQIVFNHSTVWCHATHKRHGGV